jgi:hypothetical protein
VEVPEWRIVDEVTWCAVQSEMEGRAIHTQPRGPKAKYPLTGIAKCDTCGGAIGVMNTKTGQGRVRAYACTFHHKRGNVVCPVSLYQPIDEVNGALVDFLKASVLTERVVSQVIADVKAQVEQELSAPSDTSGAEQELAKLKAEQKRYATLVAQAPDIPELLVEMRKRQTRIRELEAELAAAHRLPEMKRDLLGKVERAARDKLAALREALTGDREGMRQVFHVLFPDGLRFSPGESAGRKCWSVAGNARLDQFAKFTNSSDPTGNRTRDCAVRGRRPNR